MGIAAVQFVDRVPTAYVIPAEVGGGQADDVLRMLQDGVVDRK
jgi:hypothetical protein